MIDVRPMYADNRSRGNGGRESKKGQGKLGQRKKKRGKGERDGEVKRQVSWGKKTPRVVPGGGGLDFNALQVHTYHQSYSGLQGGAPGGGRIYFFLLPTPIYNGDDSCVLVHMPEERIFNGLSRSFIILIQSAGVGLLYHLRSIQSIYQSPYR